MLSLQTIAGVYRLGLEIGFFSKDEVIEWEDRLIELEQRPSSELIDVSMAVNSEPVDVVSALRRLQGEHGDAMPVKVLLGLLWLNAKHKCDNEAIVHYLYRFSNEISSDSLDDEVVVKMNIIEDEYRFTDLDETDVENFLRPFSKYGDEWKR
ncbi:hypothetical protein [Alicyclobacillus sp. SO9]|uniref:hypothetical protein n=1 Tax=Alicyclobacillus sp. SO9 TaxID=2665646 RepID=UPI0018E80563|nr:hypothetical protein [Alicyclobacillus sp. SO9]QQE80617.1 hypothetical protein GI364_09575 [Alicyclobacillus sp. SO9]